jgi:hypothetical protein
MTNKLADDLGIDGSASHFRYESLSKAMTGVSITEYVIHNLVYLSYEDDRIDPSTLALTAAFGYYPCL